MNIDMLLKNIPVLGLTGVASCGKDTLCSLLTEYLSRHDIKCHRFSLGDFMRVELRDFCLAQYGIDLFNCSRAEKDSIRDFLVFHGNYRRDTTLGKYWTELVYNSMLKTANPDEKQCFIITDIRYNRHQFDDYYFIKEKLNGFLIHIEQYIPVFSGDAIIKPPANEQERIFDPKMKELSDYQVSWPQNPDLSELIPYILPVAKIVKDFLK